jgi:hypothetical protein
MLLAFLSGGAKASRRLEESLKIMGKTFHNDWAFLRLLLWLWLCRAGFFVVLEKGLFLK